VGGQTLTCAIRRSGVRGLDLFLTTSFGFGLLGLGGGRSGSVVFASGAGVAAAGFGLCLTALVDLMKQS
jgi:hypothetical protein